MTCECNLIVRRWVAGKTPPPYDCRNDDLHPAVSVGLPWAIVRAMDDGTRAAMLARDVDSIAVQLAWWLPTSTEHPKHGGAARHERVQLELARAASEIEREIFERVEAKSTDGVAALRHQASDLREAIAPDFEWRQRSHRAYAPRYDGERWFERGSAGHRRYVSDWLGSVGRWNNHYCERRRHERRHPAIGVAKSAAHAGEMIEVDVYFDSPAVIEHLRGPAARVKSITSNLLELEDVTPRRFTPRELDGKERGRAFLLSKQRRSRSQRGPR